MSGLPALPLWIDAWVSDTVHLSRAERGLYHDLLVLMWKTPECRVPNDIEWISRKLRCSPDEVEQLRAIIAEFCQTTGNWIVQKRLVKEYEFVTASRKKQSGRAKSRWNKEKDECRGNAPTPTPTPTPTAASKDVYDVVDAELRKLEGITQHPVAVDPVVGPIVNLVQQGYDLKTEILPSIKRQLSKRNTRRVSRWSFFVPGIIDDRATANPTAPAQPLAEWEKRLAWARQNGKWSFTAWGPSPHKAGCKVPESILLPGDGVGWTEWRASSSSIPTQQEQAA